MALQVLTYPFCGSCGWDFTENLNDDVFCDACGADLNLFVDPGQIPPADLVATPGAGDISFAFTPNPGADSTEFRSIQTSAPVWTAWSPAVSPEVIAGAPGETICIEVRSVVAGTPGPASQTCDTIATLPATGATEGTPGIFTPSGAEIPADFAGMAGIIANPLDIWSSGASVQPADASNAYWDGTEWLVGLAPGKATGATAGAPGSFTPPANTVPKDFAGMAGVVASPLTLWTVGQSVVLQDASNAYWDSAAWAVGIAPA